MLPVERNYASNFKVNIKNSTFNNLIKWLNGNYNDHFMRIKIYLQVMWDFDGIFRYSPMFYGYFSKINERGGYNIPLAYFCAGMVVYIFR